MMRRSLKPLVAGVALVGLAWTTIDVDPRLAARLDPRIRDAVAAIVDSAQRDGLQTEPLVDFALEGSAKRAPGDVVVRLVGQFARDMRRARAALGPMSTPEEVTAGAKALRSGVDLKQLERLRSVPTGRRYAVALNTMTYMIGLSVPADTSANVFIGLVLASATDEQISLLQKEIERDIMSGRPSGLATTERAEGLVRTLQSAKQKDGGSHSASLPSSRGTTRVADPAANGTLPGTPAGSVTPGPRGKPLKRP